jgi:hypothetical protein
MRSANKFVNTGMSPTEHPTESREVLGDTAEKAILSKTTAMAARECPSWINEAVADMAPAMIRGAGTMLAWHRTPAASMTCW